MRPIQVALMLALLVGCGADSSAPSRGQTPRLERTRVLNHPPEILSARLTPESPTRDDTVYLVLETRDPDRDALDIEVTWVRNHAVIGSGPSRKISAETLSPGDVLLARVRVSDGEFEEEAETEPVSIQNRPPRVTSLQIRPETVLATDSILADVETQDPEGDDVTPRYQWFRNGVEIRGATGPILDPGQVRRGDTVQAAVSPVDERGNVGQEVRSAPKRVQNSPPTILSNPPFTLAAANRYEYQIQAEDPDGDHPLRYDLVDGPRGMRVDVGVGRLTWTIPTAATGDHDVEVSVRDLFGGETRQRYSLSVGLEAPPAAPR